MYRALLALLLLSVSQATAGETSVATPKAGDALPEATTVEEAARNYRIEVYNTLRTDRAEYDRYRRAGDQMLLKWQKSGAPKSHRDQVIDWFASARPVAELPAGLPLPSLPELPERAIVSQPEKADAEAVTLQDESDASGDEYDPFRVIGSRLEVGLQDTGTNDDFPREVPPEEDPFVAPQGDYSHKADDSDKGSHRSTEGPFSSVLDQLNEAEQPRDDASPFTPSDPADFLRQPLPVDFQKREEPTGSSDESGE